MITLKNSVRNHLLKLNNFVTFANTTTQSASINIRDGFFQEKKKQFPFTDLSYTYYNPLTSLRIYSFLLKMHFYRKCLHIFQKVFYHPQLKSLILEQVL